MFAFPPMLTVDKVSYEIAGRWLFQDATLQVSPGDRIGLIGRNGTGKTTLLRMISGMVSPTSGAVTTAKDTKIGFLQQELLSIDSDKSVFEVGMEAFEYGLALEREINDILARMEAGETSLAAELSRKQEEFEAMDGYNFASRCRQVLAGLGFSEQIQNNPYQNLSGGWRMRVQLAKLLLQEPDVLLLDEPTNHLDLPSIEWLEGYLQGYRGAMVVVSHDRYFLDRLITRIVELSRERFHFYNCNYSRYLIEKDEREEQHKREYENQQKMISETERFINRFRAKATKAKQVQSKVKMLEKLERIAAPESDAPVVNFKFATAVDPGKVVLDLDIQSKSYGDLEVLSESRVYINRGDKIALIGANGIGKSTMLRIVAGMEPFSGERKMGHNVETSFYAQHQLEALDMKNDVMQEMHKYSIQFTENYVRNILGTFLFSGDDVYKKISVLSGGEKSRVALAKTLMEQANFLLLDEPTNHLDIQSVQILIKAMQGYEGTFVVVSHDRHFLSEVANKIWYIEDKQLKEYPGTYAEFEASRGKKVEAKKVEKSASVKKKGNAAGSDYREEKKRKNRIKKLEKDVSASEVKIEELEALKKEIVMQMADPEVAREYEKLEELQSKLDQLQTEIDATVEQWEKDSEELESISD